MLKKILEFLKSITFKMRCCYESSCSINDNDKENNLNELYNEISQDCEELEEK